MSIKLMSLVWEQATVGGSELLVLLALADYADDEGGSIYPSMQSVAKKARLSVDQARRVIHKLVANGVIELVEAGGWDGKHNRSNQYRIVLATCKGGTRVDARGVLATCKGGTRVDAGGGTRVDASTVLAPVQDDPSYNHHIDPPLEKAAEAEPAAAVNPDVANVWKAWDANMPGIKTPVIVDGVNDLLKEYSSAEIVEAISIACQRNRRNLSYIQGILAKGAFSGRPSPKGGDYRPSKVANSMAAFDEYDALKLKLGGTL